MARVLEVFRSFLFLGLSSFGGPSAHVGYFRREFVEKRQWLSEEQFAQLFAVCQFLPGPASSQLGFGIGLFRAGWLGALAAFLAFTTPSVLLLILFALVLPFFGDGIAPVFIHGLKLVALVVVAHAVWGMWQQLCADWSRRILALSACVLLLGFSSSISQMGVIILGGIWGGVFLHKLLPSESGVLPVKHSISTACVSLILFTLLFLFSVLSDRTNIGTIFYQAGAMVFGGGHVVLPLLEEGVVSLGLVGKDEFLSGYGMAQALPGPLFSLSAYLGYVAGGMTAAVLALIAIFTPGFLLLVGVLPFWQRVASRPVFYRVLAGVNAAVVGLLAAAWWNPVFIDVVQHPIDVIVSALGMWSMLRWKFSPLVLVIGCVLSSFIVYWWVPQLFHVSLFDFSEM